MNNEMIVREACEAIWCRGEIARCGEFYADDFRAYYPMTDWGEGVAGVQRLATDIRRSFPDYHEQIDELICAEDHVIVRLTLTGCHKGELGGFPATGKNVTFNDVSIIKIAEGKIIEQRGITDYLSLFSQLGIVELPA